MFFSFYDALNNLKIQDISRYGRQHMGGRNYYPAIYLVIMTKNRDLNRCIFE